MYTGTLFILTTDCLHQDILRYIRPLVVLAIFPSQTSLANFPLDGPTVATGEAAGPDPLDTFTVLDDLPVRPLAVSDWRVRTPDHALLLVVPQYFSQHSPAQVGSFLHTFRAKLAFILYQTTSVELINKVRY